VFSGTGPLSNVAKGNVLGTASGAGMTTALALTDANIVFYGSGANWAGMGTDSGGNWWLRTGNSGSPYPALFVYAGDQGVAATNWMGPAKQVGGYQTKFRFDSLNTASYETNATQSNFAVRTGGGGFYWIKNDTGYEGGANQATLMGVTTTGALSLWSAVGALPPAGYAQGIGYGGATGYGIGMRPVNDAGHNAMVFMNAVGTGIGTIGCTSTGTSFNTTSSAELKEDLKSFDAGSIIDNTNVYDFKWKSTEERAFGVLAQQAVEVYPTAVTHTINPENKDDEFWGVDYSKYVPVLLQELKALRARVAQLEGGATAQPAKKK